MSGYLNALLRASGLAGAKRSTPQRLDSERVVDVPFQEQEPHEAAVVPARAESSSVVMPPGESPVSPPDPRADPPRTREELPPAVSIESNPGVTQSKHVAPPSVAETAMDRKTETVAAAPGDTKTAAIMPVQPILRGIDAVRAAIRWVAADPGLGQSRTATESAVRAETESRMIEAPVANAPIPRAAQSLVDKTEPLAPRSRPLVPALASTPVEPELTRERPRRATASAAIADTNTVEVSIGAIHVKVDPPPSSTAVRAQAPAARGPAPSRLASRSSLARRALRRL